MPSTEEQNNRCRGVGGEGEGEGKGERTSRCEDSAAGGRGCRDYNRNYS